MEWVEVRGETLDEAKEEALDQLGVDRADAEFEIVQEAESRWMGLKKTEARVRARVRPTTPPAKKENGRNSRRSRGRRGGQGGESRRGGETGRSGSKGSSRGGQRGGGQRGGGQRGGGQQGGRQKQSPQKQSPQKQSPQKQGNGGARADNQRSRGQESDRGQSSGAKAPTGGRSKDNATKKEAAVNDGRRSGELVPLEEQQTMVVSFLEGLVESFGLEASVSTKLEDETLIGTVDGSDLGLLVGPRGGTLRAIQEISRSAVQRMSDGRDTNRLMVDVAQYRERRRAALGDFAQKQARHVVDTGAEVALEPMSSADRKAIHDAVVDIAGVDSISRGDDPYRKVVLLPEE